VAAVSSAVGVTMPVFAARAGGGILEDVDGNRFIDLGSGIAVTTIGNSSPRVVDAVREQVADFTHTCFMVTPYEEYVAVAEHLNRLTPGSFPKRTALFNSGAEAVENAVSIARYYTRRRGVICFEGGYHGRTLLTLSLTSKYGLFKKGFGPFGGDIYRLPAPNLYRRPPQMTEQEYIDHSIRALRNALISQVDPADLACILIEPVQGEAGFIPMPAAFLQEIRNICNETCAVMICDEIQSGCFRTGKLFASEHYGIVPDMITIAKSLGAGLPISATTGRAEIMDNVHLGGVGGTYGGSPVTCVAALEVIREMTTPAFAAHANKVGQITEQRLAEWKEKYSLIGDVRGLGPMRLVEFVKDRNERTPDPDITLKVLRDAVSNGIILIRAGLYSNCIRLLPPLVITEEQLHEGLDVLEGAIARAQNS
jgi:4-aminobutyrate aminotransferase/(S)-3-amino-2-methylpropionate transaminase